MKHACWLLLAALVACTSSASAGDCCGWWGAYYGYSSYSREYIPYFSQHPPVYYSYPVPRTYGWSPYAYPPGTMTPELDIPTEVTTPTTIRNPYFKPKSEVDGTASIKDNASTSVALRIANPFVNGGDRPAGQLAKVRVSH